MQLTIQTPILNKALRIANLIGHPDRTQANLVFRVDPQKGLKISTNPNNSAQPGNEIRVQVPTQACTGESAMLLPGRILRELIAFTPAEDPLNLADQPEAPGHQPVPAHEQQTCLYYQDRHTRARINGAPISPDRDPDQEPGDLAGPDRDCIEIPGEILRQAVERVSRCRAGKNYDRATLQGTYLELDGEMLCCASADGFRLALQETRIEGADFPKVKIVLPPDLTSTMTAAKLSQENPIRLLIPSGPEPKGRIGLAISSNNPEEIRIEAEFAQLEGQFPNFRPLIPADAGNAMHCGLAALRQAVHTVGLVARQSEKQKITIDTAPNEPEPNLLIASDPDPEVGQAQSHVAASVAPAPDTEPPAPGDLAEANLDQESPAPDTEPQISAGTKDLRQPVRISFKENYLGELVDTLEGDEQLKVDIRAHNRPASFSTADGYTQVIMPIYDPAQE